MSLDAQYHPRLHISLRARAVHDLALDLAIRMACTHKAQWRGRLALLLLPQSSHSDNRHHEGLNIHMHYTHKALVMI
jgi:hypothetical protein